MLRIFCLLLYFGLSESSEFKLSHSKLLLPYHSHHPVNQTLTASDGGCHTWTSSSSDVINVQPIVNGIAVSNAAACSNTAMVTAVWQADVRTTAYVLAHNKLTNHEVKCDVIVDRIHHLAIETTTQELYLHDAPEALVAKAYDTAANTFSSLEGLPFEWHIGGYQQISGSDGLVTGGMSDGGVLRFITWTESTYTTPAHIARLESIGLQGFTQLVVGQRSGMAHVTVSMKEDVYRGVIPGEVKLLVRANALLAPARAYLMPMATVDYHVHLASQGSLREVSMPSPQFTLVISNTTLATLDEKNKCSVTALVYGETVVTLIDENLKELNYHRPTSLVHIVAPSYLQLQVLPGRFWVLQVGRTYEITVSVLDHNNHQLHISSNMRVMVTWPAGDYFRVLESSPNGTWFMVEPLKKGTPQIVATMRHILHPTTGEEIALRPHVEGLQDVEIFDPIEVIPSLVVLPWLKDTNMMTTPSALNAHEVVYTLRAVGGSGEYSWSVSERDCVSVTTNGGLIPSALGSSRVVAADVRNAHNWGSAQVEVVPVASLAFLASPREVVISKRASLLLPLAMYDKVGRPMADCAYLGNLVLTISSEKPTVVDVVERLDKEDVNVADASLLPQNADACLFVRLRGISPGFTEIHAQLAGVQEKAVAHVGAYLRTAFRRPQKKRSLLAWGSRVDMLVVNGPLRWILDPSRFFHTLEREKLLSETKNSTWQVASDILVESQQVALSEVHLPEVGDSISAVVRFTVKCPAHQEGMSSGVARFNTFTYHLGALIGNQPTPSNPYPAQSRDICRLVCGLPKQLRIIPKLRRPSTSLGLPPCSVRVDSGDVEIPVVNEEAVHVDLIFLDEQGMEFDRADSIPVTVSVVESEQGPAFSTLVKKHSPKVMWPTESTGRPHFLIHPVQEGHTTGSFVVKAVAALVDGRELQAVVKMRWSSLASVVPKEVTLFHHPQAFSDLMVKQGSGQFVVHIPQNDLSVHSLSSQDSSGSTESTYPFRVKILLSTLDSIPNDGHLHFSFRDLCFPERATSGLNVEESGGGGGIVHHHEVPVTVRVVTLASLEMRLLPLIQVNKEVRGVLLPRDSRGQLISSDLLPSVERWSKFSIHVRHSDGGPLVNEQRKSDICPVSSSMESATQPSCASSTEEEILRIQSDVILDDVEVDGVADPLKKLTCLHFRVLGVHEGAVNVRVSAETSGRVVSTASTVQVYPPLTLVPRDVLLLVGSERELTVLGGPLQISNAPLAFQRVFLLDVSASTCGKKSSRSDADRCSEVQLLSPYDNATGSADGRETNLIRGVSIGGPVTVRVRLLAPPDPTQATFKLLWRRQHLQNSNSVGREEVEVNEALPMVEYSEARGSVRVVSISSIRIQSPIQELLEGETLPLHVVANSAFGEVSPLSLSVSHMSSVEVSWSLSGQYATSGSQDKTGGWLVASKHVKLWHLLQQVGVKPLKTHLWSGIRATAVSPGSVTITVTVNWIPSKHKLSPLHCPLTNACSTNQQQSPSTASKKESPNSSGRLIAHFNLRIIPRFRWNMPHLHSQLHDSMHILITANSGMQLRTSLDGNGEVHYSILHSGNTPVEVSPTGYLWAPPGSMATSSERIVPLPSIILATFQDTKNSYSVYPVNQSIHIRVDVANVAYVMLHTKQSVDKVHVTDTLPSVLSQGGPYIFHTTFHDRLGRAFHVVDEQFSTLHRPNRRGVVEVDVVQLRSKPNSDKSSTDSTSSVTPLGGIHESVWHVSVTGGGGVGHNSVVLLCALPDKMSTSLEDSNTEHGDFLHIPTGQIMQSLAGASLELALGSGLQIGDSLSLFIPYDECSWSSSHAHVLALYPVSGVSGDESTTLRGSTALAVGLMEGQSMVQCLLPSSGTTFVLGPLTVTSPLKRVDMTLPHWRPRPNEVGSAVKEDNPWMSLFSDKAIMFTLTVGEHAVQTDVRPTLTTSQWSLQRYLDKKRSYPTSHTEKSILPFECSLSSQVELGDVSDVSPWAGSHLPVRLEQVLHSRLFLDPVTSGTAYTCLLTWFFRTTSHSLQISQEDLYVKHLAVLLPQNAAVHFTLRRRGESAERGTLSETHILQLVGGFHVMVPQEVVVRVAGMHTKKLTVHLLMGSSLVAFYEQQRVELSISPSNFLQVQSLDAVEEVKISDIQRERAFPLSGELEKRLAKVSRASDSVESGGQWNVQYFHKLPLGAEVWTVSLVLEKIPRTDHRVRLVISIPSSGQRETVEVFVRSGVVDDFGRVSTDNETSLWSWPSALLAFLIGLIAFLYLRFSTKQLGQPVVVDMGNSTSTASHYRDDGHLSDRSQGDYHDYSNGTDISPSRLWSQGYSFTDANRHSSPMKRETQSPYFRVSPR